MSKKISKNLTYEERASYAANVKSLRTGAGMQQDELATAAGIARATVSAIENGSVPQTRNLIRIYEIFGIDITAPKHEADTEVFLGMLGGMLDATPANLRQKAGNAAAMAIAKVITAGNVTPALHNNDLHELDLTKSNFALAASTDNSTIEEQ